MKGRLLAALVIVAVGVLLTTAGCCPLLAETDQSAETTTDAPPAETGAIVDPSLDEYLEADTKTGEYTLHTTFANGTELEQSGEFWMDGRLFRYDLYQDGEFIRSILTPDGETAYFAQHPDEICQPSVAPVDHYLTELTRPDVPGVEDGIDEETGATRITYAVKEMSEMAGASNAWYREDITYLVKDDVVIGVIVRGAVPEDDGSIGTLQVTRRMFSNVEVGVPIRDDLFVLPYPVQDAD